MKNIKRLNLGNLGRQDIWTSFHDEKVKNNKGKEKVITILFSEKFWGKKSISILFSYLFELWSCHVKVISCPELAVMPRLPLNSCSLHCSLLSAGIIGKYHLWIFILAVEKHVDMASILRNMCAWRFVASSEMKPIPL